MPRVVKLLAVLLVATLGSTGCVGKGKNAPAPQPFASVTVNNRAFIDNIAISRKLPSITTLPSVEASFNQAFKRAFFVDADIPTAMTNFFTASRGVLGDRLSVPRYALLDPEIPTEE